MYKTWQFIRGLGLPLDGLLSILVISVWFVVASLWTGMIGGALIGCLLLLIPACLIWFGDFISEITEGMGMPQINSESPGALVKFMGWVGLAVMIAQQARGIFQ